MEMTFSKIVTMILILLVIIVVIVFFKENFGVLIERILSLSP